MFVRIRAVVGRIPRGKVATYGDIAYLAGYPGAARQVVWALRGAKGLPWHRVVGAGGNILLSGTAGMEQRLRLEAEGVAFSGLRIDMSAHHWTPVRKTKRKLLAQRKRIRTKAKPRK